MKVVTCLTAWLLVSGCKAAPSEQAAPSASSRAAPSTSGAAELLPIRTSDDSIAGLRIQGGVLGQAARWGFSDVALDRERTKLSLQLAKGGALLGELLPPGALLVVNGGYFEPDFRPTTWLVEHGVELSPKSDASRGGVLALGVGNPYIGALAGLPFRPELAVQSFPLVVEGEGKLGIYRDDGHRAARTLACLVGNTLHFIVISAPRGDGPTLFEMAQLLSEPLPQGFGCSRALNLDGGPSSGVWFAPELHAKSRPPFAKVGYAIAVWPQAR